MKTYSFITLLVFLCACALVLCIPEAQAGLDDGLVAYWKFDEGNGTTAADASTQVYPAHATHTATLYNGVSWADGFIGKALSFDGADGYALVHAAPEINNLPALTYALWMYVRSPNGFVIDKSHGKTLTLYDNVNNPRNLCFSVPYAPSALEKYSANNSFPLNQWVHVAVTWDGTPLASGVHMYVNGVETPYRLGSDGVGTLESDSAYNLFIGKYTYAAGLNPYFNGLLDEVLIYNRALSAAEVQELYAINSSGNSLSLAPINTAPAISAMTPYVVTLPDQATLATNVTDDGLPEGSSVSMHWSVVNGPGNAIFSNAAYQITEVTFFAPGSYTVRLTATDGALTSYQDVQVTVLPSPLRINVLKSGTGGGSVTGYGINCGAYCSETLRNAGPITLNAMPDTGSVFVGWAGGGCAGTGPCTVTVDSAKAVTAFFDTTGSGMRVFYVDTQNPAASDTNVGTLSQPWKTIQKAASTAIAGDKVIVKKGEYNEFVTMQQSGTADNPIVFEGERGPNGEWLTIIDPSTPASTGWVLAPEIGPGVYKKTDIGFDTHELTIDHKRVAYVWSLGDMSSSITSGYANSGLTTGAQILALPSNVMLTTNFVASPIRFWDGVEALFESEGGVTYLRFRDDSNPNGRNIRVAPNLDNSRTRDLYKPAVNILNNSYIVLRNFMIRGAFGGVQIYNANSHHNIIESNYLMNGYSRVTIGGQAYKNVIRNNEMTANYYGYGDPGAWDGCSDYRYAIRAQLYIVSKFLMGGATEDEHGIKLVGAGDGNEIYGNRIFQGIGQGVLISGSVSAPTTNTDIHDNTINNTSCHGFMLWEGHTQTKIHDNTVYDTNINFRLHHMNAVGETDRVVYIYRNRSWLQGGVGSHLYTHFNQTSGTYHPEFWIYQNSFSGGGLGIKANMYAMPGVRFLNNIFSGTQYVGDGSLEFMTDKSMMGIFDYNLVTAPFPTYPITGDPAWFGSHNIKQPEYVWGTEKMPDFALSADSKAIDAGIDVSQPFMIDGVTYPALPGMDPGYFSGIAPDIGAYEYKLPVAEDVSGDGTVSAYDAALALQQGLGSFAAAQVAQRAVGLL